MARTRYTAGTQTLPLLALPAAALRAVFREGYRFSDFKRDALAGLVVGIVAVPLAMALSIAVGAQPERGLYTAIVAGALVAVLGGSRTQVTGPTAAFIVILAPIYAKFGLGGLLLSGLLGGVILLLMGVARLGRFIEFIPHPVTTGFTAGIATVIAILQIKDAAGLTLSRSPEHTFDRIAALYESLGTINPWEILITTATLALLFGLPKVLKRIPAPLIALPLAAGLAAAIQHFIPDAGIAIISSRFHYTLDGVDVSGIPRLPPMPMLPWDAPGPDGLSLGLTFVTVKELLSGAFAVAMLGAIESLLSAVVADGMAGTKHDPDAELIALGIGNIVTPFFGGIPATGAIARTATNVRSGGRSPMAAVVHAGTVLLAVLILAPTIGHLPMAALAALLLLVAWNMAEVKHFGHILRVAPRSDALVLLTCFSLTVVFDMVVAVSVGIVLAALLFMRRMADLTQARLVEPDAQGQSGSLPQGVVVYDINGPLFFGAAQKAMGTLGTIAGRKGVVILRMNLVSHMDATGLVALESAVESLRSRGVRIMLVGLQAEPASLLARAGLQASGRVEIFADLEGAVRAATLHITEPGPEASPTA